MAKEARVFEDVTAKMRNSSASTTVEKTPWSWLSSIFSKPEEEPSAEKEKMSVKKTKKSSHLVKEGIMQKTCGKCSKSIYPNDPHLALDSNVHYHKSCARCATCNGHLSIKNFSTSGDRLLCKTHFKEEFSQGGGVYAGDDKFRHGGSRSSRSSKERQNQEGQQRSSSAYVSSDLVAERMQMLEERQTQGQKQQPSSAYVSSDLVAERMQMLEERQTQGQKQQQQSSSTYVSSDLVAERMQWLEEKQKQGQVGPSRSSSVQISSDLVAERMQLLEQKQMQGGLKKEDPSQVQVSSDLVAERMRLLEERQMQEQQVQISSSIDISSDLVAERMRLLEERQRKKQDETKQGSPVVMSSDLVAERLQLLSEGHAKNRERKARDSQQPPGRLDPNRAPSFTAGQSGSTASRAQEAAVYGSLAAETRARFLAENQATSDHPLRTARPRRWGENFMPHVEEMDSNILVEVEQEGLLPGFLAEHTSWLFGAKDKGRKAETAAKPHVMDVLRLDYEPNKPDDTTQSTDGCQPSTELDQDDTFHSCEEMMEDSIDSQAEGLDEPALDLESEQVRDAGHGDRALVYESADEFVDPISEMTSEERKAYKKTMLCSFCEIL